MARRYEVVYIFDSALDETQVNEHLARFHALLKNKDNQDPIDDTNHWGKRTLAYPIKGRDIGYYVVVQLTTDPTLLTEFERLVKLEEAVLRYQLVINEGAVPAAAMVDRTDTDTRRGEAEMGTTTKRSETVGSEETQ